MAVRTDWKAVWIGVGATLMGGAAVGIWPSQVFAWAALLLGALITGVAFGGHFGGKYIRLIGGAVSFIFVIALYFFAPHPPVFERSTIPYFRPSTAPPSREVRSEAPQTPNGSLQSPPGPAMVEGRSKAELHAHESSFHGFQTLVRGDEAKADLDRVIVDRTYRQRTGDIHLPAPVGKFSGLTNMALAERLRNAAIKAAQLSGNDPINYQRLPDDFHEYSLDLASLALERIGDVPIDDGNNLDLRAVTGANELRWNLNQSLYPGGLIPFFLQLLAEKLSAVPEVTNPPTLSPPSPTPPRSPAEK